jgi:hypothetical protein
MPPFVLMREGSTPIPRAVCGAPRTALASDSRDREDLRGGHDGRAVHSTRARSAGRRRDVLVGDMYTTLLSGAQADGRFTLLQAVVPARTGPTSPPPRGGRDLRAHELVTAHLDDSVGAANQSDQRKRRCCFEAAAVPAVPVIPRVLPGESESAAGGTPAVMVPLSSARPRAAVGSSARWLSLRRTGERRANEAHLGASGRASPADHSPGQGSPT